MGRRLNQLLFAALIPITAANDPFLDMLQNKAYDREAILRQFQHNVTTTSPPEEAQTEAPAQEPSDERPTEGPRFRLVPPTPLNAPQRINRIALVLPLGGQGLAAVLAARLREGCLQSVGGVAVDVYATDGSPPSALSVYQQALSDGAQVVVGPMQKSSVRLVVETYETPPVPTLLLQWAEGAAGYYAFAISAEAEAESLARSLQGHDNVLIVLDQSSLSRRQSRAFARAWHTRGNSTLSYFHIYDTAKDWRRLFNQLKAQLEGDDSTPDKIVFAAGDGKFIRLTRNFVPDAYPVYGSSLFRTHEQATMAMFLDNLRIMEMPWFVDGVDTEIFETDSLVRTRPVLQQRFYALGVDACRMAKQANRWSDSWFFSGVTGDLTLHGTIFHRQGVLMYYKEGLLQPLP